MSLISPKDRIFIAGDKGMAGSAISRALYRSGYENQITATRQKLDLRNSTEVKNWFTSHIPDIVVLAAAKVGGIYANSNYPSEFLLDNLKIQNNVIESSFLNGVKRFLFLGSSCIYPKFAKQPIKEEALLSGYLEPSNEAYAIAKIAGIKLCTSLRLQKNFDAICLMPTNLYGPGDNYHKENSHVIPALIRRIHEAKINQKSYVTCWGSGNPLREFLHCDDLGEACLFSLENWTPKSSNAPLMNNGDPLLWLNVGTGKDLCIKELVNLIANIIGYNGKIIWDKSKPDGTPRKQLDVSKLKSIGWEAKIDLKEGLKMAYNDFLNKEKKGTVRK